ncbi:MAG TPA: hypothetical protein VEY89_10645 [Candidatus Dormibacteraeota bacterium]|nr:hypothetical protein [Candidatus Dormibacteraeota bacterium]
MQARGVAATQLWLPARVNSALAHLALFALTLGAAGAVLATGTMMAPVHAPVLPTIERSRYAGVAVGALLFVVVCAAGVVVAVRTSWGRQAVRASASARHAPAAAANSADLVGTRPRAWRLAPLAVLRPELVPARLIVATAAISLGADVAAWLMGFPPWMVVSLTLAPWVPLLFVEGVRKYRHYGLYAVFGAIALLQVGHLGEHSVQVVQVFLFNGDLSRAHGVFGQLDFETVHFTWDTIVWLGLVVLLLRFGRDNPWLIVSFAAASLHEIEHLYLFYVYRFDPAYYSAGGFAGIMGSGGVVGSPLARPYLHFAYNVLVIVPLLFAFWRQTVNVFRETGATR